MTQSLPKLYDEVTGLATPLREPVTGKSPAQPYTSPPSTSAVAQGDLPQNNDFPPVASANARKGGDSVAYLSTANIQRPWLAIPGKRRFVWPLGIEGFNISVKPDLSIHKYLGDNNVEIDVMHVGEERIQLSGMFAGKTSVATMRALRDICLQPTPERGKILHLPLVLPKYQYVFVEDAEFDRSNDIIGDTKITYRVTFVKATTAAATKQVNNPAYVKSKGTPERGDRAVSGRVFFSTQTINTARKIALTVYGNEDQWTTIAEINAAAIQSSNIPMALVPDFRLNPGTAVYY